jgi:hypothetical protein
LVTPGKVVKIFLLSKWALNAISFLEILYHEAKPRFSEAFITVIGRHHLPGYYGWRYTVWGGKEVACLSTSIPGEMLIPSFAWVALRYLIALNGW